MTKKVFDIYKSYLPSMWNIYGKGEFKKEDVPQALRVEYEKIYSEIEKKYSPHIVNSVMDEIVKMIEYLEQLNAWRR